MCTFIFQVFVMHKDIIIRALLFFLFFAVGLSVMTLSLLFNDIYGYYQNKEILAEAERNVEKLKTLNDDYDALLGQLRGDSHFAQRLAPATLGIQPKEKDVAYPRETVLQLAAARVALMKESESGAGPPAADRKEPALPGWVERCKTANRRLALFIAGSALILIAFVYFGPTNKLTMGNKNIIQNAAV
jgi:cell division protein FtsL